MSDRRNPTNHGMQPKKRRKRKSTNYTQSSMSDLGNLGNSLGSGGNRKGGILNWIMRRVKRAIRGIVKQVDNKTYGNVDKSKVNDDEDKPNYIDDVDSFAKEDKVTVAPVYNYGGTGEELGNDDLPEGSTEEGEFSDTKVEEDADLWDKETVTESDKEFYTERLSEMSNEVTDSRKEIIRHYRGVSQNLDTDSVNERDKLRKQIYKYLQLDVIENVPYFLKNGADIERQIKETVPSNLYQAEKDAFVEEELKRYRDIIKDFVEVTEKEGKYFLTDWKLGIKVIDFMVKDFHFPEIILLLTPSSVDEVVKMMRTGYLPDYLRETPLEKMLLIFEELSGRMVRDAGNPAYAFPKAYVSYKQQLPMYTKLRNNGRLASVNSVMGYFYNEIDKIEINGDVEGDAYLGLIEPDKFVNAYVQFFYGRAKQSQAMSDVTLKIMKKDPTILPEVGEKGYAVGDKPKDTLFILSGHLVLLVNMSGGHYNAVLDKAPSDITTEDITNITGMFSAERKKEKQAKKVKPKSKAKPAPKKKEMGLSYDYDKAMEMFSKK